MKRILNYIGLQTSASRVVFFLTVPFLLFAYRSIPGLPSLSIYHHLGLPAPSIGLTRSFWDITRGDVVSAWQRNKLIFPVLGVAGYIFIRDASSILRERSTGSDSKSRSPET